MLPRSATRKFPSPFKNASTDFVCGEPQEETLARIEYLKDRGPGWCLVTGPHGIGKSMLLTELARRAHCQGESCCLVNLAPCAGEDWLFLVADAWLIPSDSLATARELRRRLEEHMAGLAAINRPVWVLVDHVDAMTPELARGCRWLIAAAAQRRLPLTIVIAVCDETDQQPTLCEVDLVLELVPWDESDCTRYVEQYRQATESRLTVSPDAVSAMHERTSGVPGPLATLCEWTWLAAQAETLEVVDADLVHAVGDELSPSAPPRSTYDHSAAYGAW